MSLSLNLWPRYYSVFSELTNAKISLEQYKDIKRKLRRDEDVANELGVILKPNYYKKKAELLEDMEHLKLDKSYFSHDELKRLLSGKSLILTKRKSKENFEWELKWLGIDAEYVVLFDGTKEAWVRKNIKDKVVVIGDSVDDLRIGRIPSCSVNMVGYGLGEKNTFCLEKINFLYLEKPSEMFKTIIGISEENNYEFNI